MTQATGEQSCPRPLAPSYRIAGDRGEYQSCRPGQSRCPSRMLAPITAGAPVVVHTKVTQHRGPSARGAKRHLLYR